jgi:hypothetical protein
MFGMMNDHWQRVRKQCGQWSWNGYPANITAVSSGDCATANSNLIDKAAYLDEDIRVPVTLGLTESLKARLWSKVTA